MSRIDGFEAHAVRRWEFGDIVELFLLRSGDVKRECIVRLDNEAPRSRGHTVDVEPGTMVPGLYLPAPYAEPLRDALDEMLGRPRDDYRARYEEAVNALICERQRVDQFLNLFGAAAERALFPPAALVFPGEERRRPG